MLSQCLEARYARFRNSCISRRKFIRSPLVYHYRHPLSQLRLRLNRRLYRNQYSSQTSVIGEMTVGSTVITCVFMFNNGLQDEIHSIEEELLLERKIT